jgi:hypothetical protein
LAARCQRLASSLGGPTRRQSNYRRCACEANNRSRPPAHSTAELKLAIDGEFSATLDATKNTYQLVRLGVAKRVTDLTPQMRLVPLRPATKLWDGTPPSPPTASSVPFRRGRFQVVLTRGNPAAMTLEAADVTLSPILAGRHAEYRRGALALIAPRSARVAERTIHGEGQIAIGTVAACVPIERSRLSLAIWAAIACVARLDRSCSCC